MKSIFTLCFWGLITITLAHNSFAQNSIVGRVTDSNTGDPIKDVQVYWWGSESRDVRSNVEGVYVINGNSENDILVFEKPGKTKKIIETNELLLDSLFWELDVELDNKELESSTSSGWAQSIYEIPSSAVIIDQAEISRKGYMDLNELLENVPGFYTIDHRSDAGVSLGVRGQWSDYNQNVLIQVNGVSMLSERRNDFPMYHINIPMESIARVEIFRGPSSVSYGAGAFYAIINIITLDPGMEGTVGNVSAGVGTQNNFNQQFQYSLNERGLLLSLSATNNQRDGFQQQWDDMADDTYLSNASLYSQQVPFDTITIDQYEGQTVNPERYSRSEQSVNLALRFENISADIHYARTDMGFSILHPGPTNSRNTFVSNATRVQLGYSGRTQQKYNFKNHSFSQFKYTIRGVHRSSQVDADYKFYIPESYSPGEDRVGTFQFEANSLWIIHRNERENKSINLTSGISHSHNYQNYSLYNASELNLYNWRIGLDEGASLNTNAAYSQFEAKFDKLTCIVGARLERQEAYKMRYAYNDGVPTEFVIGYDMMGNPILDSLELVSIQGINASNNAFNVRPIISAIYALQKNETSAQFLKFNFGTAFKQSSAVDNATIMAAFGATVPFLRPERIRALEVGYSYKVEFENYQTRERTFLFLNLNAFHNHLDNVIERQTFLIDGNFVNASLNSGIRNTTGLEATSKFEYSLPRKASQKSIGFYFDGNISYQKSTDVTNPSDELSFSPEFLGGANVSFEAFAPRKDSTTKFRSFSFSIGMNHVGQMNAYHRPSFEVPGGTTITAQYIGRRTPGYYRWSLNFRMRDIRLFHEKQGGFRVNVHVSNLFDTSYSYPTNTSNPWADLGILGRQRQIMCTIGYSF